MQAITAQSGRHRLVYITVLLLFLPVMFSSRSIFNALRTTSTRRFFSTTTPTMSGSAAFFDAVKARRSYYALEAKSPVADAKIIEIINETVKHTPSR